MGAKRCLAVVNGANALITSLAQLDVGAGDEVMADYALRAKREYPKENLIAVGYCNEVQCYVPSLRVLREGGYEADTSMIYYGLPLPYDSKLNGCSKREILAPPATNRLLGTS